MPEKKKIIIDTDPVSLPFVSLYLDCRRMTSNLKNAFRDVLAPPPRVSTKELTIFDKNMDS